MLLINNTTTCKFIYTGNACLILHEFFGLYLKRLDSNMVHSLFCGYCLCSLHCCCLGNIKSDDKSLLIQTLGDF